jgi:hypothetical protein
MMLKKISFFLLLNLYFTFSLFADVGPYYFINATITLNNGEKYKGYFRLENHELYIGNDGEYFSYRTRNGNMRLRTSLDKDSGLSILETDYHFHSYIKRILKKDSIQLNQTVVMATSIPVYIEGARKIRTANIHELKVHYVNFCAYGVDSDTKCNVSDISWLRGKIIEKQNLGGNGLCSYEAYFFQDNKMIVQSIIKRLMELYKLIDSRNLQGDIFNQNDYDDFLRQVEKSIEVLRKEKVIIIHRCSC